MSDEQLQFQSEINTMLKTTVCEMYAATPEFELQRQAVLDAADTSDERINTYLVTATGNNVALDQAITCVKLFLQLKSTQQ